jgi:plastocyanin
MCAAVNGRKRVFQEAVLTSADGGLANVFVRVRGTFPRTSAKPGPVTIDQRGCVYGPRVVGVQVGQVLQVRNSDDFMHNVHGLSSRQNGFNVSEPKAGMVRQFQMKNEEMMLQVKCDIHRWMTAYVGVVSHPYFAVSGADGTFQIDDVPAPEATPSSSGTSGTVRLHSPSASNRV